MPSFKYNNVYLNDYYMVVGPFEYNGYLKKCNRHIEEFYNREKTFEKAEISFQKEVLNNLLIKAKPTVNKIDLVVGGDLLNQISVTGYNMRDYDISFLGVYGACATFNESLIILSNFIDKGQINSGIAITSSHNLNSEKQFRFPVEYGAPKPERTTFTATGGVGAIVSKVKSNIKIKSSTIGKMVDFKIKDPYNMGGVMAPACAKVIYDHLNDLNLDANYYDLILSGDLGFGGAKILKVLMKKLYNIELKNYMDAGTMIYRKDQPTYDGASGPTVLPFTFFSRILGQKKYKKILLVGTGAMHSPVMVNQKDSLPGIAYAVGIEVL